MNEPYFDAKAVRVADSTIPNGGRGVFATADIARGELIERCPVIVLPNRIDKLLIKRTELRNYYFQWGEDRKIIALALGYGSLYNHSYKPNAAYAKFIEGAYMEFTALCNIKAGEEITVNYNGHPGDMTTLWIASIPPVGAE